MWWLDKLAKTAALGKETDAEVIGARLHSPFLIMYITVCQTLSLPRPLSRREVDKNIKVLTSARKSNSRAC